MKIKIKKEIVTADQVGLANWKCNLCGKVEIRNLGDKAWINSYCVVAGYKVRLYRVTKAK